MKFFELTLGDGPVVAMAVHAGHEVRPEVAALMAIDEIDRLREEDPYTDVLAEIAPTRFVGRRSRFEVDLNRRRDMCVYRTPEEAWGLEVWREPPPQAVIDESLANYDQFYATAERVIGSLVARHGRVVILDLHTYNHRRAGMGEEPSDARTHPEVNLGTDGMDRAYWAPLVDRFLADLSRYDFRGRPLDVRENVKFTGGHLCSSLHRHFPRQACTLAIEIKKTFMDEWTGEVDREHLGVFQGALRSALPGLMEVLAGMQ